VPGLAAIKRAALDAGALGCSLSGSGPSLFALCRGQDAAARVASAMTAAVEREIGGRSETYVSAMNGTGARVVEPAGARRP
jgi:homoserine kinase